MATTESLEWTWEMLAQEAKNAILKIEADPDHKVKGEELRTGLILENTRPE